MRILSHLSCFNSIRFFLPLWEWKFCHTWVVSIQSGVFATTEAFQHNQVFCVTSKVFLVLTIRYGVSWHLKHLWRFNTVRWNFWYLRYLWHSRYNHVFLPHQRYFRFVWWIRPGICASFTVLSEPLWWLCSAEFSVTLEVFPSFLVLQFTTSKVFIFTPPKRNCVASQSHKTCLLKVHCVTTEVRPSISFTLNPAKSSVIFQSIYFSFRFSSEH